MSGAPRRGTQRDAHLYRCACTPPGLPPEPARNPSPLNGLKRAPAAANALGEDQDYYLSVARYARRMMQALAGYLAYLGSRLVFLIDWNRARKRLRECSAKDDAERLLKWAADRNLGHRAFLQLGGEQLISRRWSSHSARRCTMASDCTQVRAGRAIDFLQFVIREAQSGCWRSAPSASFAMRSRRSWRGGSAGRIRACSASSACGAVFGNLASGCRRVCCHAGPGAGMACTARGGAAARWEQSGDAIVDRARQPGRPTGRRRVLSGCSTRRDEVADGLEEACFPLTHLATVAPPGRI